MSVAQSGTEASFHTRGDIVLTVAVEVFILGGSLMGCWLVKHFYSPEPFMVFLVFAAAMIGLTLTVLKALRTIWPFTEETIRWADQPAPFLAWKLHQFLCLNNLFLVYVNGFLPLPIRKFFYQLLGARIGKGIISIGGLISDPYLVTIEEGAMVGHDTLLCPSRLAPEELILGRITISRGAVVGARSVVMPRVSIGEGAMIKAMSMVAEGTTIAPYEVWAGNPARRVGSLEPPTLDEESHRFTGWRDLVISPLLQSFLLIAASLGAFVVCRGRGWGLFESVLIFYALLVTLTLVVLKLLRTMFPFTYGTFSLADEPAICYRWNLNAFLSIINLFLQYTNNITPPPLRKLFSSLLGARIAGGSGGLSIAGLILDPFAVTVEKGAVVGHEALILPHAVSVDTLVLRPIILREGSVVGTRSVVMPGVTLGKNATVAPMSLVVMGTQILDNEIWGGVPARRLGVRELPTETPLNAFGTRAADAIGTTALSAVLLIAAVSGAFIIGSALHLDLFGAVSTGYFLLVVGSLFALWVLRRLRPVADGVYRLSTEGKAFFWWKLSNYIALTWLSLQYQYAVLPAVSRKFLLRLLGGKLPLSAPWSFEGHIFDPARVILGSGTFLHQDSVVLPGSFRAGEMVLKQIKIGAGAVVGPRALVMPGVSIGAGARIEAMSYVEEDTQIPAGETWGGNPARKIA